MSAYDSILQRPNEALAYSKASAKNSVTYQVRVPSVDVAAIRTRTGLSQPQFARSIGDAKGTLINWEHGHRQPT